MIKQTGGLRKKSMYRKPINYQCNFLFLKKISKKHNQKDEESFEKEYLPSLVFL